MGQAIGEFLPFAVGVAISPIPIIAVILMLFSDRARSNSLAFLVGWIAGIVAAMSILIGVASSQDLSTGGQPSDTSSWIKLIIGLLLLAGAFRQWRSRPAPGAEAEMPGWMSRIDAMKPGAALGLGVLLAAVNPKNLLLIAAAAVTISQADLGSTDTIVAVAVFTVIGACTVAIPTLAYLAMGAKAQPALDGAKAWLTANDTAVMAVLLLVIGVSLIGKGLGGLLG
jgi:threonine/homoserine/homoserine lactone efflux protein